MNQFGGGGRQVCNIRPQAQLPIVRKDDMAQQAGVASRCADADSIARAAAAAAAAASFTATTVALEILAFN